MTNAIYTHNISADIVELFDALLDNFNITIPSPEDKEKDPDNCARLYGSVYYDLLDSVEYIIIDAVEKARNTNGRIIKGEFE